MSIQQPTLTTERLLLRPFEKGDASSVAKLAGEREVAYNTERIPHPYPEEEAERWIGGLDEEFEEGRETVFAVALRDTGELVGSIGLEPEPDHGRAELGFWVGEPYWGRGYATEAARRVIRYGFEELGLRRVYARSFGRNEASRRVLEKVGMLHEGRLRAHFEKWGEVLDVEAYGLLASDVAEGES